MSEPINIAELEEDKKLLTEKMELGKAVNAFSRKMFEKLCDKADEGQYGWECADVDTVAFILKSLETHVDDVLSGGNQSQLIDIANIAMMLSLAGEETFDEAHKDFLRKDN